MLPVLNFRQPVLTRGSGSYVWDTDGNDYLDVNSGQFCAVFGHSDPGVMLLMQNVAGTLQDTDTSTLSVPVLEAARKMHDIAEGMDARVLFLSTGAEAVECALRYAKHIKEKPGVISFDRAYHGQTHGSAAYSMSRSRIRPTIEHTFEVPTPNWFCVDVPADAVIASAVGKFEQVIAANHTQIAAAIFEPIVSGGGFYFPPKNYYKAIKQLCNQYGVFLIFDESQTGMGRTGTWFYYQQLDVIPDFVITAKALGLGYPVSCVLANGRTVPHERFVMEHFSSHQNEPFAGLIVSYLIDRIKNEGLLDRNLKNGIYLRNALQELQDKYVIISGVRGIGMMCAFDLDFPGDSKLSGTEFCIRALQHGLLLQHCNLGKTIRLLPSYTLNSQDLEVFLKRLEDLILTYTKPQEYRI